MTGRSMTDSLPPGGAVPGSAELVARWADAWSPEQVAERLAGVGAPWCVVAGWALDLFRGGRSRAHGDLEISVPAAAFAEIRDRFPEYACDAVGSGRVWADADAEALGATHQTWFRDPASGQFLFDVFREPHEGGTWIFRRDAGLRLPYDAVVERTADGIPISGAGAGAAVQGRGDPAQGPGRLRRSPAAAGPRPARRPPRVAGAYAARASVVGTAGAALTRSRPRPARE